MPDEVSQHVLKYTTDEASVTRSIQAVERIKDTFAQISKVVSDAARPIREVGRATEELKRGGQSVDAIAERYDALGKRVEELQDRLARVRASVERTDQTFEQADGADKYGDRIKQAAKDSQLYGDVGSRVRDIGGVAGLVGGPKVSQSFMVGGELLNAAEGFGRVKAELPALIGQLSTTAGGMGNLALAAGGAGLLAGGLYLLYDAFQDNKQAAEEYRKELEAQLTEEEQRTAFIARSTREEVDAALKEEQQKQEIAQGIADTYAAQIQAGEEVADKYWELMDQTSLAQGPEELKALMDQMDALFPIKLGDEEILDESQLDDALEVLRNRQDEQTGIAQAAATAASDYGEALGNNETAATDAKVAEEQLADARQKSADSTLAIIQRQTQDEIALKQKAATYTVKQTEDEIAENQRRREGLVGQYQSLWDAYKQGEMTLAEFTAATLATSGQIVQLDQNIAGLETAVMDAAKVREQEAGAIKTTTRAMGDSKKAFDERRESEKQLAEEAEKAAAKLKEYAEATADVMEKRAIETQREQENFERQRLNDLADHYAEMADLDAQYYDERQGILDGLAEDLGDINQERLDEITEYNQESRRLAEDHRDEILRIQRETNRDYSEAARARDTAGALAALRQGQQQLDDEQDQYTKEQDRREEDMADLLKDLEAERREKIEAAQKELADLEEKHRKERQAKERAFQVQLQREDEQRRIAAQRQQENWQREDQARQAHFGVVETATGTHYANIKTIAEVGMGAIEGFVSTAWSELVAGLAAASSTTTTTGAVGSPTVPTEESHYGYAYGGWPTPRTEVKLGERGKSEIAEFAGGYQMKVAASGPERAMFMDPVRIYAREQAQRAGSVVNVSLGGLGGVQIQAGGGVSSRSLAEQGGRQVYNMVVDALEQIISDYAGGL